MFNIRIVQADFGDCFVLEYGSNAEPRYLLIDGGPDGVFDGHLESELKAISDSGGSLDLVAVSHVDADHIVGVLELLAAIRDQRSDGEGDLISIGALWYNAFGRAIDPSNEIAPRLAAAMAEAAGAAAPLSTAAVAGISEGNRVYQLANQIGLDVNPGFADQLISVDHAPGPKSFDNLDLTIVGPTQANLDELHREWLEWLDRFGPDIASGNPQLMANADKSIPNLSSVMFLASAEGRTALFTGDGRSDHLLDGLGMAGLLNARGAMHVNVLKVMHHGSDRNATRTFFRKVTADTYVVSANGHPDNPDLATLTWIVETAREQGRNIHLIFTNETPATRKLVQVYPGDEYGYEITTMPVGSDAFVLRLGEL